MIYEIIIEQWWYLVTLLLGLLTVFIATIFKIKLNGKMIDSKVTLAFGIFIVVLINVLSNQILIGIYAYIMLLLLYIINVILHNKSEGEKFKNMRVTQRNTLKVIIIIVVCILSIYILGVI